MFGLISTKNLYLVTLDMVTDYRYVKAFCGEYKLAHNPRYAFARKKDFEYIDIFTGTKYTSDCWEGTETLVEARNIITTKKFITKEEASLLLKELNPTYLETIKSKKLIRRKVNNRG